MPLWTHLTLGALRWQVQPTWQDRLLNAHGLRLEEWRQDARLQVIKQAPHRTVYRIGLSPAAVYIKHYPIADLRALLRQRLRPSKARSEMDRAIELAARQVPTVEPLAIAEHPSGESFLVTRGLEDTLRLDDFIQQSVLARCASEGFDLTHHLAQFLAQLHDAGVSHADLHAGNLLIQPQTLKLFLIDLHDVRLGGPLNWRRSRDNLILLNRWLSRRTSRTDRRRFWRAYLEARERRASGPPCDTRQTAGLNPAARNRARDLEQRTWQSCLQLWRHRSKRCLRKGPHFYRARHGNLSAWAVRDLPQESLQSVMIDPDAAFVYQKQLLKVGRTSTLTEIAFAGAASCILKRFNAVDWRDKVLGLVRTSPARRSWVNGHRLLDCGLPTPRPLAFIQRRSRGLLAEAYLLTERLSNVVNLQTLSEQWRAAPPPDAARLVRKTNERLGWLIRALHDRQLSQRDLKASNILIEPIFEGRDQLADPRIELRLLEKPRLYLVDLVGVQAWRKLPLRHKVQNLARLYVSFRDHPLVTRAVKLRFLRAYLGWGVWGKAGWKEWWRSIGKAARDKIARNERRGRAIT